MARYLALIDAELPAVVVGLFLVGSIALEDYVPGRSDVDFVAVTVDRLDADRLALLSGVHANLDRLEPDPAFDGIYVTRDDLGRDPRTIRDVAFHLDGAFHTTGGFEANP